MNDGPDWPALLVTRRAVVDLKPYDGNARTHSDEQIALIAASMLEHGVTSPILVDESDRIIFGHGRRLGALRLVEQGHRAFAEYPVIVARGWSEAKVRAYALKDNQLALAAGWDPACLAGELRWLADAGYQLETIGFDPDELARLLAPDGTEGLTDPDDAPPLPERAVSRVGDVWVLGRHRLACGDATDAATVALALAGDKPGLMVTDPPYGVSYDPTWRERAGVAKKGTVAAGKVKNDDRADWRAAWALFPGAVAYVWHGGLHAAVVAESLLVSGLGIRAQIVWVKTRPVLGRGAYHWQHEPAFYAVRDPKDESWQRFEPEHEVAAYAVREGSTAAWEGGRKQSTVWMIEHLKNDTGHGTQKPVECMRRPIQNNSSPGGLVYDPFSGSGTTIIAAEMTGRACRALELDPAYVDVAVLRWQAFTGKSAQLEGGGDFEEVQRERC